MALTERHKQYLTLIGVQPWELRKATTAPTVEAWEIQPEPQTPEGDILEDSLSKVSGLVPRTSELPLQSISKELDLSVGSMNLEQLRTTVEHCQQCELHRTRTQAVFGVGNQHAQWMIVGEAPGVEEDRQGEPFVGRAGQLLKNMLYAIGLKREEVYIANVLKCRPPNNRDPSPQEVLQCESYLKRQVALIQPKIILAIGRVAAHNLLKTDTSLTKLRNKTFYYGEAETPLIVTYHPAYLLRTPTEKRKAWLDLQYAVSVFKQRNQV